MAEYSPMMQHYLDTKKDYKDSILFYRLGDFYEMFFDDAILASRELELTLTGKECGQEERAPMCGVPFHAAENYIARLISKGYKVAICEQMEDPKQAKGIVKREVIRVVTPGTVIESNLLDEKKNNYIMSVYKSGIYFGIAVCDVSTGDFRATQIKETNNFSAALDEISRYSPAEIVVNNLMYDTTEEIAKIRERFQIYISKQEDNKFSNNVEELTSKYNVVDESENKIEINDKTLCICAINGLLTYILETQKTNLDHINKIILYNNTKYMCLDINARRNLELTEKLRDKSKKGTLLWVLDKTSTSMGGRRLRRWINDPLLDIEKINKRLNSVKELKDNPILRGDIADLLKKVYDIERLVGKISYGNANARDLISLKNSVKQLPELKKIMSNTESTLLKELYNELDILEDIYNIIDVAIVEEPPISVKEGGIIKKGYNEEIDKLKMATTDGKNWLIQLEANEREKTGIKGLKVGFNKVFGYYIEVTKSNISLVPDRYIRKQTLTNGERYVTEELKKLENELLGAEEKVINLEYNAFCEIREIIEKQLLRIQRTADIVATLDVLNSFAIVAEDMNYCMPIVDNSGIIDIKGGRHPVIEKILPSGEFVDNDTYLDKEDNRFSIITGPNMAGKSTYMRQVALITLMAQCGSFVPATFARLGVVDKIFTRIGASDDLSMGQSTFMVEMMEVATILKEATQNSLVILDEIGRGTSTYDGLSIAWAVAEYMSDKEKCGAKTLFATHYHELIGLEQKIQGVKNYSIAVKEKGEDIIFLRKIVAGGTDESYGVHVAKLAGVPQTVTKRSNEILRTLERKSILGSKEQEKENKKVAEGQLDMYNYKLAEIAHEIDKIDLNSLTPIDALNTLVKIKDKMAN
ncbi:MAG TPA: DNA mismatch repair protein MutS [Clostridiaceae bacterium]|jgi:DNA mismatch repair protein MutS|nr:DNA mismatch repair protein MutS [Clostridia bacterium]HCF65805.1 DNA mismatch repair protein MutS [Clostridiales bacterium]HJJ09117.1 DNA mismatch repair protein MutS [Clostridiaceae bacterium]